ncbi:hypothetical protein [Halalkalicoccus jeotgali]|uniref:Uncharacterized protein n=1 Tax=Halalkalicoccus jeotgali (strain DSM 18796 / CECT 7217 / JCM 14584 / KCTC 4019 / B3) TaxID=795797 RepID=D8J2C9_HALJB|nr:hypothetical protein [Halalkalicoccus jeotgali]ADJ14886.1 hypothetical protein HacjB3_07505 [Halalkalicoccus jeotgali B3]ELY39468.1 hypothetical protein C497_05912 [Halalkalicoccus jeotgali B3]
MDYITLHCTDCDWTASTDDGYGRVKVSRLAIEHHCHSGHTVVSDDHADSPQESICPSRRRLDHFERLMAETQP